MTGIRLATKSDLDTITSIAVAALPADPVCPYRFPYMSQYPEDHAKFARIRYGEYMADRDNVVMVYECPSIEDISVSKPVAFSIWHLPPPQRVKALTPENSSAAPCRFLKNHLLSARLPSLTRLEQLLPPRARKPLRTI